MAIPPPLIDVAILILLSIPGYLIARMMSPDAGPGASLAVAFPLGAGLVSFLVFLGSWAGLRVDIATLGTLALLLGLSLLAGWRLGRRSPLADRTPARRTSAEAIRLATPWVIIGVVIAVASVISVGRSHTPFDASASWASKGYGIAKEGTVFAANSWGSGRLAYPLNVPLLISIFQLADADVLPGSKLLFPLYFASILTAAIAFWRRTKMPTAWVSVGAVFLATLPEVFRHSTFGYVNIPGSAYLTLGTLCGVEGLTQSHPGKMSLAGMLLGLACWTRAEGALYAVAICGALGAAWWLRLRQRSLYWRRLLPPIVLIGGSWFLFYQAYGLGGSEAASAIGQALAGWMEGELHLHEVRLLFGYFRRELLDVRTWGLLFPLAAAVFVLYRRRLFDPSWPEVFPLALVTLASGVLTLGLFYVGSYARGDLVAWLTRVFPRAFFPVAILMVVLAFLMASPKDSVGEAPPDGSGTAARRPLPGESG